MDADDIEATPDSTGLTQDIGVSSDRILFIQYTPSGTMRLRWYLVQVDLNQMDAGTVDEAFFEHSSISTQTIILKLTTRVAGGQNGTK
mmetsp:Transcript_6135/g.7142  ORF Transcript_6135/g.7142 Transcript_6135/m.7142 type:complete len:88 (+) Transcript_6135:217-480(+)